MSKIIQLAKQAILAKDSVTLEKILDLDINPNRPLKKKEYLLDLPEVYGHREILALLLERGGDLHLVNTEGREYPINSVIPYLRYSNGITNLMIAAIQPTSDKLKQYLAYATPDGVSALTDNRENARDFAFKYQRYENAVLLHSYMLYTIPLQNASLTKRLVANHVNIPIYQEPTVFPDLLSGILARPAATFVSSNSPLMDALLYQDEPKIRSLLKGAPSVFEKNYYGKAIIDAVKYVPPSSDLQESLAEVYINNLRALTGISGPHIIEVITINHVPCFLIGESHAPNMRQTPNGSVSIEEVLRGLFTLSPVCVDFFLETFSIQHSPGNKMNVPRPAAPLSDNSPLFYLINEYFDCTGPKKTGCVEKYPHTRMHNTEFRRAANPVYDVMQLDLGGFGLFNQYLNWSSLTHSMKSFFEQQDRLAAIFQGFLEGDLKTISQELLLMGQGLVQPYILHQAYDLTALQENTIYGKLSKQLKALPTKIQVQIKAGLTRQYYEGIDIYVKALQGLLLANPPNMAEIKKYFIYIGLVFGVLISDTYTLSRMFKSVYGYQTNCIVSYVGSEHIKNFLRILPYLGAGLKYEHKLTLGVLYHGDDTSGYIDLSGTERAKWTQAVNLLEKAFNTPSVCEVNG